MNKNEFGEKLFSLRKINRVTQRTLAYSVGVSDKVISKWENGISQPKAEDILKIAAFFGIGADELLNTEKAGKTADTVLSLPGSEICTIGDKRSEGADGIIPSESRPSGSYLCTWAMQSSVAESLGISGKNGSDLRDALSFDTLFGKTDYYHPLKREYRKDVILLLDDGWDVPYGTENTGSGLMRFGSLAPDTEKFPNCGNTPAERLKAISDKAKEFGYYGIGLWVSPQMADTLPENDNAEAAREYWEERAKWSAAADVKYWKADWGRRSMVPEYRRMMTEAVRKYAPGLMIEHTVGHKPFDTFDDVKRERAKRLTGICDVFRVYDVCAPFYETAVLDRADEILKCVSKREYFSLGLINAESSPIVAAVLGFTCGIMQYDKDTEAALRWQRLAPAFGYFDSTYKSSEERLYDTCFAENDFCSWIKSAGKTVTMSAPAVMSRGCELPRVIKKGSLKPFVAASNNPVTGAYTIASIHRTVDPNREINIPAKIELTVDGWDSPIGVFGYMESLTLVSKTEFPKNARIFAEDMLSDTAVDITDKVKIGKNGITLDGRILRYYGKYTRGVRDTSTPSVVIFIKQTEKG